MRDDRTEALQPGVVELRARLAKREAGAVPVDPVVQSIANNSPELLAFSRKLQR